jgi:Asp/Glu/hydantoin racemase
MRIVVLNPNTSTAMTTAVVDRMRARLPAGIDIVGRTAHHGPPVIASRETFAEGARSGLALAAECIAQADALVLACFGDPGLAEIQATCTLPVIGLAGASIRRAESSHRPWAIVTAGCAWCEMLRELVHALGASRNFVDVYAIEGTGLDAMRDPALGRARVRNAACKARAAGAESIILGGAALAGMADGIGTIGVTLLDCIDCASDAAIEALCASR